MIERIVMKFEVMRGMINYDSLGIKYYFETRILSSNSGTNIQLVTVNISDSDLTVFITKKHFSINWHRAPSKTTDSEFELKLLFASICESKDVEMLFISLVKSIESLFLLLTENLILWGLLRTSHNFQMTRKAISN